tara:strand:- start:129 stop:581 length:453 start_codon:yes stop_codon:yes gene_type:complete
MEFDKSKTAVTPVATAAAPSAPPPKPRHTYHSKPDNCCVALGKRLFKRWFPFHATLPFTEEAKKLKLTLNISIGFHSAFFIVSLVLIGFEPMSYNIFLGLMCYSASLTLSICTIYIYLFFLLSALSGGLTWGIKYSDYGSGGNPKGLNDI